jgi:hypothetical protein
VDVTGKCCYILKAQTPASWQIAGSSAQIGGRKQSNRSTDNVEQLLHQGMKPVLAVINRAEVLTANLLFFSAR